MTEPVDVLIIGAGAAGAAFAWSLADTRMNILCLEQGDWMNPAGSIRACGPTGKRASSATSRSSPNVRRPPRGLPRQRQRLADRRSSMFNAVGGSTILYAAHFPRFHPSDFRVRTLDGVADDWPIDYATLEPYYDAERRA